MVTRVVSRSARRGEGLCEGGITKRGSCVVRAWPGLHVEGPESVRVYLGLYEVELNRWLRRLVTPETKTFDVGAQYGLDAVIFARLGAPCVVTVEAYATLAPVIQSNIDGNHVGDRVSLEIGYIGDGSPGTMTLDQLAAQTFRPGFVKMDIEGQEAAALRGAPEVLACCDRWLIETHGLEAENECLGILAASGFSIDIVNPRWWLADRRPIFHNRWIIARRPRQ